MKIISKYKDYYDYLQGMYGIDNKVVLDRTKGQVIDLKFYDSGYEKHSIHICGKKYEIACNGGGKCYIGKMLLTLPEYKINKDKSIIYLEEKYGLGNERISIHIHPLDTIINEELKCPIVYKNDILFPRLSDFNIQKILSAEEIYHMLYTWIENHSILKVQDNRTNSEKIISVGFDLKTSFRNIK